MSELLDKRSQEIFRNIIDAFVDTGEPVGSRTLSKRLGMSLSPATIRNIMADLEDMGLLYSPHTSAGRLPTEAGLRFFINGMLEISDLSATEKDVLEQQCHDAGRSLPQIIEEATATLSVLTGCAGLVIAPKQESPLKHIEFVHLGTGRALVVLVTEDGIVENRIIHIPPGLPPATLTEASHYLAAHYVGRTLDELKREAVNALGQDRTSIDELASKVIEAGLGLWAGGDDSRALIIKGQSHLLDNVENQDDIDRLKKIFKALETKENIVQLLDATIDGDGVQIFIGADNHLFSMAGCSLIVSPYKNSHNKIVGAVGVIGPSRLNYSRIIPMVDYTAKIVSRLLG